ncbi:salicylate synthase [Thermocatellispora tengchongensis]|uniref:Salicylate synthase n=2 Tax=Thermocatellispora tengchongensis TaxID=1073253 RepID=A0A840P772_9ACTN|nr:salicylate synthase [Thermocatellispora tengchongensis]MBB5133711.1 salicylate synthase [Thermocatellispora tengchongensis]
MSPTLRYRSSSVPIPGDPMPAAVRVARRAGEEPFVLYECQDTWSVALGAAVELTVTPAAVRLSGPDGERTLPWSGHPGPALRELTADLPVEDWTAYGTAAFELAYAGGPAHAELPPDTVLLHLVVPRTEVRVQGGTATVRALDPGDAVTAAALAALADTAEEPEPVLVDVDPERGDGELYRKAVHTAVREIQDGALHKVILSRVVPVPEPVDLAATYLRGRRRNTPARSFLLNLGGMRAAGFSPEIVLSVDAEGRVRTQPLAGTRALTGDAGEDARLRRELLGDPKEVYEHAISVRTSFEELEAVCAPGSVRIADYMTVKPRGTAQHLGSDLYGRLAPGRDGWDALAALFPAVTVSGIPKAEAYDAIRRLETEARGLYGGAVLTVGRDGALDAALVLRSVYQRDGRTWLRAGAGVVGQSLPEREFTETCEKLRSVSQSVVRAAPPSVAPGGLDLDVMRRDVAEALRRPETEVEDEVSLIVQGLDSVGLMTVVSKWSAYGVRLKLADLARDPRLVAWAELVRRQRSAAG